MLLHNVWSKDFLIKEDIFSIFEVLTVEEVQCFLFSIDNKVSINTDLGRSIALFWRGFVSFFYPLFPLRASKMIDV